jgi:hypothetical protein
MFQHSINKTSCSKRDNFITKDTMETASNFIPQDCLQTQYDALESPRSKGEGRGSRLRIG